MALTMRFNAMVEDSITALVSGGEVSRNVTDKDWGVAETMEGTAQDAKGSGLYPVVDFVASLPDFADFRIMCDIGGNHGT